jgi:1,4-dihydroxy-2-naphthoate polyprenyltransferase
VRAAMPVSRGGQGPALIPALAQTGLAMLVWSIGAAIGLFLGA